MNRTASLLLAFLALASPLAARAVPGTVSFTARLADNGKPVTGTHNFTFKIFDALTAGTDLWDWSASATPASLPVNDGVVSYSLGSDNPFGLGVFTGTSSVFLEVTYDGVVMSPRLEIQSVPYAFRSFVVETIRPNYAPGPFANPFGSLALGPNYILAPAFTPPANGHCLVATSVTLYNGTIATTSAGPYYRVAVQRAGVNGDDGQFGMYPGPIAGSAYANMSRTRAIAVTGGTSTAFGCALLSTPSEWVGRSVDCIVDRICFY